eukprot:352478-Chlamydomonas_euryale.AAC.8
MKHAHAQGVDQANIGRLLCVGGKRAANDADARVFSVYVDVRKPAGRAWEPQAPVSERASRLDVVQTTTKLY